ncbi:Uxx-star family glutaredoxin-like (seleno)protein [Chloroflexota bacterium]
MDVKVYTTPTCGYCHQAKDYLNQRGVPFTEFDVSRDRQAGDEMVRLTGQTGVPVIIVEGQVIIGFDRPRLESLLAAGNGGGRVQFGLKVADALKISGKTGAYVGVVSSGSPGGKAGLRKGDIITALNNNPVGGPNDLAHALSTLGSGNKAEITYLRGSETLKSGVVL